MKRERAAEETDEERTSTANVLILLSESETTHGPRHSGRLFGCKTCNRQFASFQALGGHRASHKKPRIPGEKIFPKGKPRTHECPICKVEFSMGQALGGHMRRHRVAAESYGKRWEGEKRERQNFESLCLDLDLNTFPMEKETALDLKSPNLRLGLALVNCLH